MILRIKTTDFSTFAGYRYMTSDCNKELDKYIELFNNNPDFRFLQIEDTTGNNLNFHTVCYISDKIHSIGEMYTETERGKDGKISCYRLCFCRE